MKIELCQLIVPLPAGGALSHKSEKNRLSFLSDDWSYGHMGLIHATLVTPQKARDGTPGLY